jgi:hypothetical protein
MTEMSVDYCCGFKWLYATVEVLCQGILSLRDNVFSSDHTENILLQHFFESPLPFHLPYISSLLYIFA